MIHRLLIAALLFCSAQAWCGDEGGSGQEGNGGGGVRISANGDVMTFFSDTLDAADRDRTPGLDYLSVIQHVAWDFRQMERIPGGIRRAFLQQMRPSHTHKYYKLGRGDATKSRELIDEFRRVSDVKEDIIVFAITNRRTRETFLLEHFSNLKLAEQKALLFHETYWLVYPGATYEQVVGAEMAFQALLKKPRDAQLSANLMRYLGPNYRMSAENQAPLGR